MPKTPRIPPESASPPPAVPPSRAPRRAPETAKLFAALADPTRLALLARLADGPAAPINALATGGALTRQALTKHLHVLESAGFVRAKRIGRETRFAYQPRALEEAQDSLDALDRRWRRGLDRLQALVDP